MKFSNSAITIFFSKKILNKLVYLPELFHNKSSCVESETGNKNRPKNWQYLSHQLQLLTLPDANMSPNVASHINGLANSYCSHALNRTATQDRKYHACRITARIIPRCIRKTLKSFIRFLWRIPFPATFFCQLSPLKKTVVPKCYKKSMEMAPDEKQNRRNGNKPCRCGQARRYKPQYSKIINGVRPTAQQIYRHNNLPNLQQYQEIGNFEGSIGENKNKN